MYYVISVNSRNSELTFRSSDKRSYYTNFIEQAKLYSTEEIMNDSKLNNGIDFIAVHINDLNILFDKHTTYVKDSDTLAELIRKSGNKI